jgi:lysophospholipase L1-like esterase
MKEGIDFEDMLIRSVAFLPTILCIAVAILAQPLVGQTQAEFTLAGDWKVRITAPGKASQTIDVRPVSKVTVIAESYRNLPLFNPKASGWTKGAQLKGVKAQETTSKGLIQPDSFILRNGPQPDSPSFTRGTDYEIDVEWGTFGRLAGGSIREDQEVFASYRHEQLRLDAVILQGSGKIIVREGISRAAAPEIPEIQPGEQHLGNIYLSAGTRKLTEDHLYPILETRFPAQPHSSNAVIARLKKQLSEGQRIRILAWGDSVTDGSYLPDRNTQRWQEQFVSRLRRKFPQAKIELITEAWGGRNTGSYLAEPPGSLHNYQEKVLAVKPDVIISEFVNDAGLKPEQVQERYGKLLRDFQEIGAEWIILTPHYVRPDWMNLTREREIDEDPRPYVKGLRQFATSHDVALADASLRYGRLWRQGIPYSTLMLNAINHPNAFGMSLFADALLDLFE